MKIAICLSGQISNECSAEKSMIQALEGYHECDLFVFSWSQSKFADFYITKQLNSLCNDCVRMRCLVFSEYTPVRMAYNFTEVAGVDPQEVYKKYFAVRECKRIRNEYEKEYLPGYDLAIRCEAGVALNRAVPLWRYLHYALKNLIVPNNPRGHLAATYLNSDFAFGAPRLVDSYGTMYDSIRLYTDNGGRFQLPMHPGVLILNHLVYTNSNAVLGNFKTCHLGESPMPDLSIAVKCANSQP